MNWKYCVLLSIITILVWWGAGPTWGIPTLAAYLGLFAGGCVGFFFGVRHMAVAIANEYGEDIVKLEQARERVRKATTAPWN